MKRISKIINEKKYQKIAGLFIIIIIASFGMRLLIAGHAQSPSASSEAESGSISGLSMSLKDSSASGGLAVKFGGYPLLGALVPASSSSTLYSNGFREVVVSASWSNIEPSQGAYSSSAISNLQSQINNDNSGCNVIINFIKG